MNETDIARTIDNILRREGGFSDDPADRGGRTNFGITQATADEYALGDVAQLTREKAAAWYRAWFKRIGIDQIPDAATFDLVADCCVNHGASRGIKWLQQALGVAADGVIGPATIAAFGVPGDWDILFPSIHRNILASRLKFYAQIVYNNPTQRQFLPGWINRACEFLA